MTLLEERSKELNPRQKALRQALLSQVNEKEAITLFLALHGILHSSRVSPQAPWSYEDMLLDDLSDEGFRYIPEGEEHSVAWIVWHLSRIEDVTMNLLVAGKNQEFEEGGWLEKTRSPFKHTGNGTGLADAQQLSQQVDISALRAYRYVVGRATREIVRNLTREDFQRKVAIGSLQRVLKEGAVIQAGMGVIDYWGRRDVAGLLLMPPTRHAIIHWNEARRLLDQISRGSDD